MAGEAGEAQEGEHAQTELESAEDAEATSHVGEVIEFAFLEKRGRTVRDPPRGECFPRPGFIPVAVEEVENRAAARVTRLELQDES